MNEEKYIELINKEISGTITPRESDALHEYLQADPGARKLCDELTETSRLLSEVADVEPPEYLKKRIINSLDFSRYEAKQSRPVMEFLMKARKLRLKPRFAYTFALGVAVGLVVYSMFLTTPTGRYGPGVRDMYGTIGISEVSRFAPVERVPISLPQARGSVNLLRSDDVLRFEVSVRSPGEFEVVLEYDFAQASFGSLRPRDRGRILLETRGGYVRASGSGEEEFALSFVKETAMAVPFEFTLLVSGEMVHSHRFLIAPDDEGQSDEAIIGGKRK